MIRRRLVRLGLIENLAELLDLGLVVDLVTVEFGLQFI